MTLLHSKVVAHSNIALAKYWGKADIAENLPAVPSLSMTLDGMRTVTSVTFEPTLEADEATLDDAVVSGRPLERITRLLDAVRARAGVTARARVESSNDFPTASGLASSASGFAALALAAVRALGLELTAAQISGHARAASASAARSLFGGFVALPARGREAEPVAPAEHFPLFMLVAVTTSGPKSVGSTEGMQRTARTSPYYPAWLEHAPRVYEAARSAVLARDLPRLGEAMEQSALMMHASMFAAEPGIVYFTPATLAAMQAVRDLRARGTAAYFTMDAGPHVKVLTGPPDADRVERELTQVPGVVRVIRCGIGPGAYVIGGRGE
jgi:diphosphomevalonate decarboxylase